MSFESTALSKMAIRETIEDYLNFLDAKNWDGIASCFTEDAQSWYNFEATALHGGRGVVDWLRAHLSNYSATDHALSNLHIEMAENLVTCDSRVTASLLYEKSDERRISVRAILYRDKLRREENRWLIMERVHEPQWQYEVPAHEMRV